MKPDIMAQCADLIFADAVQDLARSTGKPLEEVRAAALLSPAYEMLYDFDTGLWQDGPDFFASLIDLDA
ncbi:hypothetical protein GMI69_08325 [Eggerthellaceae bacterium zg-887]|uniref:hypothetical protein n=1 Tax=Xiamenia xianingshaonis TaxID=2682776 RepID=UPI001408B40A|nr:hypothetical protein [Xiamenia xianingshaonis]NHM16658.1 hypothetical protein [Xiamenia xianingshaonis]